MFVVASARAGFDPAEVLFEREGMRRDHPPGSGSSEGIAGTVAGGARKRGGYSTDDIPLTAFGGNNTAGPIDVATARNACASASGRMDFESETFVVHGTQDPCVQDDLAHTLGRNHGQENAIAFQSSQSGIRIGQTHATLDANNGSRRHNGVIEASGVRRLTPRECERLQGFPDDYTMIPWRGKPAEECPDGPRYKAIGNSKAIPVVRWIGRRLMEQMR